MNLLLHVIVPLTHHNQILFVNSSMYLHNNHQSQLQIQNVIWKWKAKDHSHIKKETQGSLQIRPNMADTIFK